MSPFFVNRSTVCGTLCRWHFCTQIVLTDGTHTYMYQCRPRGLFAKIPNGQWDSHSREVQCHSIEAAREALLALEMGTLCFNPSSLSLRFLWTE